MKPSAHTSRPDHEVNGYNASWCLTGGTGLTLNASRPDVVLPSWAGPVRVRPGREWTWRA